MSSLPPDAETYPAPEPLFKRLSIALRALDQSAFDDLARELSLRRRSSVLKTPLSAAEGPWPLRHVLKGWRERLGPWPRWAPADQALALGLLRQLNEITPNCLWVGGLPFFAALELPALELPPEALARAGLPPQGASSGSKTLFLSHCLNAAIAAQRENPNARLEPNCPPLAWLLAACESWGLDSQNDTLRSAAAIEAPACVLMALMASGADPLSFNPSEKDAERALGVAMALNNAQALRAFALWAQEPDREDQARAQRWRDALPKLVKSLPEPRAHDSDRSERLERASLMFAELQSALPWDGALTEAIWRESSPFHKEALGRGVAAFERSALLEGSLSPASGRAKAL